MDNDWYRPGRIKVLSPIQIKVLLAASDKTRFVLLNKPLRLIDRYAGDIKARRYERTQNY